MIVVVVSLVFTAINLACIFVEWFVFSPLLNFITLFYGVFIGYFSVIDIYDDLITRTAEGSDAVACSQLCKCCFPKCVGVQFWVVAVAFNVIGLYLGLVWMVSGEGF